MFEFVSAFAFVPVSGVVAELARSPSVVLWELVFVLCLLEAELFGLMIVSFAVVATVVVADVGAVVEAVVAVVDVSVGVAAEVAYVGAVVASSLYTVASQFVHSSPSLGLAALSFVQLGASLCL